MCSEIFNVKLSLELATAIDYQELQQNDCTMVRQILLPVHGVFDHCYHTKVMFTLKSCDGLGFVAPLGTAMACGEVAKSR
jgi:hypothetical protein